jgi:hypothetical protein
MPYGNYTLPEVKAVEEFSASETNQEQKNV